MTKTIKLIHVSVDNGKTAQSNKYYHMFEQADGTFKVEYGRVEKTKQVVSYPMELWDKKLKEKSKKGYKDVTHLFAEIATSSNGTTQSFSDITNSQVKSLIDTLQAYAKKTIKANYSVSADKVTEAQVNAAQDVVNELSSKIEMKAKAYVLNPLVLELYRIIPRQMANVKDHLFDDINSAGALRDAKEKINDEQSTLDVMAGQVALNKAQAKASDPKAVKKTMTMLDVMGLEVGEASTVEIAKIKKMLGSNANQFKRAFKVTNKKTEAAMKNRIAKASDKSTELFFHGSRNENWFNILETGLLIRPSGAQHTGSMFGDGIYMADKAQKSLNYSSLRNSYYARGNDNKAYLALYTCHTGNQKSIHRHDSTCYSLCDSKLSKNGYDSVFAKGGIDLRNNEYVFYNKNSVTISFLIEVSS